MHSDFVLEVTNPSRRTPAFIDPNTRSFFHDRDAVGRFTTEASALSWFNNSGLSDYLHKNDRVTPQPR